jgi:hypothetical protein
MTDWRPISPERATALRSRFKEQSLPPAAAAGLKDNLQRHFVAAVANWDSDEGVLSGILASPELDRGTLGLIFWRACPNFYQQYAEREVPKYHMDTFRILRAARSRLIRRKWTSEDISYGPEDDGYTHTPPPQPRWPIDAAWIARSPGARFPDPHSLTQR